MSPGGPPRPQRQTLGNNFNNSLNCAPCRYASPGPPAGSTQPWRTPRPARALARQLPLVSSARTRGEEVSFDTGSRFHVKRTPGRSWPRHRRPLDRRHRPCPPYGPTPIPHGECRLASPCNGRGRVDGGPRQLASVRHGDPVRGEPRRLRA
ncbi:cyclophilin-like family protein [Streptomyces sp. NPDC093260]|uniref:cyclophilin-like family protein n=1 Tax=Streptomyces sp. NPDC093260 TaxID=3155073 RepID=UPI003448A570